MYTKGRDVSERSSCSVEGLLFLNPLSRHSEMAQAPSVGPSQEEWSSVREHIEHEYLLPESTLGQVMKKMADTYEFFATEAMYKRKLREWGLRKSLHTTKRDQLIELATKKHKSGQLLPQNDKYGRIIPWDRVRRYCRSRNTHKDMWDVLQIPERPPVISKLDHRLRRSKIWLIAEDVSPCSTLAMTLYQPRSPTHHVSLMISQIRNFQDWRSMVTSNHETVDVCMGGLKERILDTAREDAALKVVNESLIAFRHLQFGYQTSARQHFDSAAQNFDLYLDKPSMFLVYAILMLYWNVCPDDQECLSYRDKLFQHFQKSCEDNLGLHSPLTKIVQQLNSSTDNVEKIWSIALYSWILNTKGSISTRPAAKYTAANVKIGLARALQNQGYNTSAISVYQEFLSECQTDTNPLHGKARPTQCRLANLYRIEHRYEEALALLDTMLADVNEDDADADATIVPFDEGLIYCHSLRGQILEEMSRLDEAMVAYRTAVQSARAHESQMGLIGPLTIMYGRVYYEFLCRHEDDERFGGFERALFECEYSDVMDAIERESTCIHTGKNQLLLLNTFADVGIYS